MKKIVLVLTLGCLLGGFTITVSRVMGAEISRGREKERKELTLRSNVLNAARLVLTNRQFRRALILDRTKPLSYPEQLKKMFRLSPPELSAICSFAVRVHQDEYYTYLCNNPHLLQIGGADWTINFSEDFWEALRGSIDMEDENEFVNKIEQKLGIDLMTNDKFQKLIEDCLSKLNKSQKPNR